MPTVRMDEKGRILLPKEVRERIGAEAGEEFFVTNLDDDVVLKRIDVEEVMRDLIEKAREVDLETLEQELEAEVAKRKHETLR